MTNEMARRMADEGDCSGRRQSNSEVPRKIRRVE